MCCGPCYCQALVDLHQDVEPRVQESIVWYTTLNLGIVSALVWACTLLLPTQSLRERVRDRMHRRFASANRDFWEAVYDVLVLPFMSAGLLLTHRDTVYYSLYVVFAWLGSLRRYVG